MRRLNAALGALGLGLLLGSCTSAPPQLTVQPDGWTYGPRLVTLQLEAAEALNLDSGQAHALSIGIFQLSDPAVFGTATASPAGASKFLDQGADADASVVDFDRVVLQPGEKRTVYLNRAANSQYVGIVAGYYQLVVLQDVALFNIPVIPKPVGWVTKGMMAVGLQGADTDGIPGPLALSVGFGPDQVARFASDTAGSARIFAAKGGKGGGGAAAGGKGGGGGGAKSGGKMPSLPTSLPSMPKAPSSSGGGSSSGG
ncbi:MAG TPA: type VI secretion system lipoprotein TssJ [Gammaproteobacteria bacterium]|nr:type VI secretion system lipoprotein TssJ [Gammaproteobacteria bacterium]